MLHLGEMQSSVATRITKHYIRISERCDLLCIGRISPRCDK